MLGLYRPPAPVTGGGRLDGCTGCCTGACEGASALPCRSALSAPPTASSLGWLACGALACASAGCPASGPGAGAAAAGCSCAGAAPGAAGCGCGSDAKGGATWKAPPAGCDTSGQGRGCPPAAEEASRKLGKPGGIVAACGAVLLACGGISPAGAGGGMLCAAPGTAIWGMKCARECISGMMLALPCCCAWAAATATQH